jgi:hypothetical protein
MRTETGGPAFPRPASEDTRRGTLADGNNLDESQEVMSLRDWFAGHIVNGVLHAGMLPANDQELANLAMRSYALADAMLKARSK